VGILAMLHHLFPVFFLTFILAYIGNTLVNMMTARFPYRRLNLVVLYLVGLAAIVGYGSIVIPRVASEAKQFVRSLVEYGALDGEEAETDAADATVVSGNLPAAKPAAHGASTSSPAHSGATDRDTDGVLNRQARKYLDKALLGTLGAEGLQSMKGSDLYEALVTRMEDSLLAFMPRIGEGIRNFFNYLAVLALHFFLSTILSFIIIWDMPRLTAGALSFAEGRTADIYAQIAPGLRAFAVMLGRAFEAQTGIAFVNSMLTTLGFWILGIPSIALLGTIVFFCSYIPVLGVFLSTLPAAILALRVGGFITVLWLVAMVLLVHAIEAYGLNPLIYGHHFRVHPVAVLVILLIGEHLFGIWGLLLGVPVSAFVLKYVIKGESVT
jgi:predicted PurR-regulated permease PerM